jgi:hypothetical protein
MNISKVHTFAAAAGCALALAATPALALTFANTSQIEPGESTFFFSNNGDGTSTISGSGQAELLLTSDFPLNVPGGFQVADFTYSGISTQAASLVGPTYQQLIDSGTLTFTNALGNLLTVNFTNGLLGGRDGGVFLWGGDDSSISAAVDYTSDFDTPELSSLNGLDNFMLALTINPATDNLALGANGQLASFEASAVGTYRTAVPEPATWAMMIVGLGGAGALLRRRRATGAFA